MAFRFGETLILIRLQSFGFLFIIKVLFSEVTGMADSPLMEKSKAFALDAIRVCKEKSQK